MGILSRAKAACQEAKQKGGNRVVMGRASIFRHKRGGDRVQGEITKVGSRRFEGARKQLAKLAGRDVSQVSDADVIEALARGEQNTRDYLTGRLKR